MYKHKLQFDSQLFQSGMTVPVNTTAVASAAHRVAGAPGRLAITVTAKTAVTLAAGKIFTITYQTSATEGGSFAAPDKQPTMAVTFAGGLSAEVGDVIASLIIPQGYIESDNATHKWLKAVIGTDDAAASGTVDVFVEYLAN